VSTSDRWRLRRNEIRAGARVARLRQMVPRRHTALSRFLYEFTVLVHGLLTRKTWPRPDVVVAVSPSLSGALLARRFARQHGVPMIVIVQDLVALGAEQSGIRGGSLIASLLGRTEARVLLSADLVGLAHGTFSNACIRMGIEPEKIRVVPNWSLRELPRDVQAADIPDWKDRFVVLHAGNMGFKQGLEVVVDAARLAEDRGETDLLFVLMGDGNRRDALEGSAQGISTLTIRDPAPEADFPGILAAADVLLVTQRPEVVDMSVASKLTTYFTAGRPVVCSATATGGTATEVQRAKAGRVVPPGEADALLEAVLDLRQSPEEAAALGRSGQAYAQDHLSASAGLDRVVELIASAVVSRASR
jgi:colanic acid biosynthesis glycosyl transferase WcaI